MENRKCEEKTGKVAKFCNGDTAVGYDLICNSHLLNRGIHL